MEKGRAEGFSDAIFAVAITLLVLDLHVPPTTAPLAQGLVDEWPEFATFAVSFALIGIVWVNHHALFHRLSRVTRGMLFTNLFMLFCIVSIPFATSVLAAHLLSGGADAGLACAVFNIPLLLMGLSFGAISALAGRAGHFRVPVDMNVLAQLRSSFGAFVYAVCIPVGFLNAPLALGLDALVAVVYIADQMATGDAVPHRDSPKAAH